MHRPDNAAGVCDGGACHRPGYAEIGDLCRAVLCDQYVMGFYIPVNYMVFMRMNQRLADLLCYVRRLGRVKPALFPDNLLQRSAFYIFHNNVVNIIINPHVVYAYNVLVRQAGRRLGFLPELLYKVFIACKLRP